MKLGFDAKRATHNSRGLGNYSRGLLEGLLSYSDSELFLYTPDGNTSIAQKWLSSLDQESNRYKVRTPNNLIGNLNKSLWRSFFLKSELIKDQIDIYHGLSHEIPYLLKSTKFKKIVTMHDLIFMRYPEFFPLIDRLAYKEKFSYAVKNSDKIIAICEQTKEDLITYLGASENKIVVHYQSCDPIFYETKSVEEREKFKNKYNFKKSYILNVGAFEPRKNQKNLIEGFSSTCHLHNLDLVLIGAGKSYLNECKDLAQKLNLNSRIHFYSNISFSELPLFYQAASIFCFPSLFEGFGIPIIEALFSKLPVITSHGSCFPESAGPQSFYIDPYSKQEIGEAIIKVVNHSGIEQVINEGFEFVQKFHRKNSTQALVDIYHQTL